MCCKFKVLARCVVNFKVLARCVVNFKVMARCVVHFKVLARCVVNFKVLLISQAEAILVRISAGSCDCETLVFSAGLCLVRTGATHP